MQNFRDLFSKQSAEYAKHRPTYPDALFAHLAGLVGRRNLAWDCATGNGQAARGLAPYFEKVWATDASEKQLSSAEPLSKVHYQLGRCDESGLGDGSADLVTVAQAFHWFDHARFYDEVRRVAAPGGVLAVWCYTRCLIDESIDALVEDYYAGTLGPYWGPERAFVDAAYSTIEVPFQPLPSPRFSMHRDWTLGELVGYLGTWSALQTYREKTGKDPLEPLAEELSVLWPSGVVKTVEWPLYLRTFRVG